MIPVSILGAQDKNQEATVYLGNLDEKVNESLIWEVMIQAGPVKSVNIPRDRITQLHQGYAFCEFTSELDADYAVKVMNGVRIYGKPIKVNRSSADKRTLDVGANLFVGNLAPEIDEKLIYDTFGTFGTIITAPTIARDPNSSISRGFGFVSFDCFEASDAAIEAMNGQYLCNRPISVSYAFKKDGNGERHGSQAERLLATQSKKTTLDKSANTGLQAVQPQSQPLSTYYLPSPSMMMQQTPVNPSYASYYPAYAIPTNASQQPSVPKPSYQK